MVCLMVPITVADPGQCQHEDRDWRMVPETQQQWIYRSRDFTVVLNGKTEEEWPWVYTKENKAALVISTLEALAVVALKLQFGETPGRAETESRS